MTLSRELVLTCRACCTAGLFALMSFESSHTIERLVAAQTDKLDLLRSWLHRLHQSRVKERSRRSWRFYSFPYIPSYPSNYNSLDQSDCTISDHIVFLPTIISTKLALILLYQACPDMFRFWRHFYRARTIEF